MSILSCISRRLLFAGLACGFPGLSFGQAAGIAPQGGEYVIGGRLAGDQVFPQASISPSGGYLVWQDSFADGDGLGISAQRLNTQLSGSLSAFRVNEQATEDQERPGVALFDNGGAVFVWQGGRLGFQKVYSRFLNPDGTFATGDVQVNSFPQNQQIHPVVASLADRTAVVVWASFGQDDPAQPVMQGVFAQRFTSEGRKLGNEFQINTTVNYNQRTPAVAGLKSGGFVVTWVSEKFRTVSDSTNEEGGNPDGTGGAPLFNVEVYARLFQADGTPQSDELRMNSSEDLCANPSVFAKPDSGFVVAWSAKDSKVASNSWDIFIRQFDRTGQPSSTARRVNAQTYGDQFAPRVSVAGESELVVWNSLGQDGSAEGVFGQFLGLDGIPQGSELLINSTTVSQQIQPSVAADGVNRHLVFWSGFGLGTSFDLYGQRFAVSTFLLPPATPIVSALSQSRLMVSWPELAGLDVGKFEVYVDGSETPVGVQGNHWIASSLPAGTVHSFRLAYRLNTGERSPVSPEAKGATWSEDDNGDGLPDDWQKQFWGSNASEWPASSVDTDGDGATNFKEYLAGTHPRSAASVLRIRMLSSTQGWRLEWNTEPGSIYQVQTTLDFIAWDNLGGPRFAHGASDAVPVAGNRDVSYYRMVRVR